MIRYALDTDALSLLERGHSVLQQRVASVPPDELATTIISVEEQLTGWQSALRRARQPDEIARIYDRMTATVEFLSGLSILSFTEAAVRRYNAWRPCA
jgi:tRNA(fMet)-specific endonuclease VapC